MIREMTYIEGQEFAIIAPWPIQPFFLFGHHIQWLASKAKSLISFIMKSDLFRDDGFSGMTLSSNVVLYEE